jgi:hypothetical protein
MSMKMIWFALVLMVAACGGASDDDLGPTVAVEGYVHAGPVCPVVQDPPDPACDDRPVAGAELDVFDGSGNAIDVATVGDYLIVPRAVDGLLGTAGPQEFSVGTVAPSLDIAYDTGIR